MSWYQWKPYVSVAQRRQRAIKTMAALRKRGVDIQPVEIEGRKIATTFWGESWCDHIESFSDFANRLPRGRSYVRNGSVCHLAMKKGVVEAKVSGSDIYNIRVKIKTLPAKKWQAVKQQCSGQIGSLLELLQGNLSDNIMEVVTNQKEGLFPLPGEMSFDCDCPDWADMCKHVAAVLYGVGARLDKDPALLFQLRGVDHEELIDVNTQAAVPKDARSGGAKQLASDNLGDVFGIDIAADVAAESTKSTAKRKSTAKSKPAAKRSTSKKTLKPKGNDKRVAKKSVRQTATKTPRKRTNSVSAKAK